MNFAELRDAVRERCGLTATDQMATPANMGVVVNAALHELETRRPAGWPWAYKTVTAATVLGQQVYPFSSLSGSDTWLKIRGVRLLYGGVVWEPLETMAVANLRNTYPSVTPQMPFAWAVDGYNLVFGPVPNDVWSVQVDVVIGEPDLAADADVPLMPSIFHQAIVDLAAAIQYRRLNESGNEQMARADVQQMVTQMLGWARPRTGPGHQFIRDPNA